MKKPRLYSDTDIEDAILNKFLRKRALVKRHIYKDDVAKGFPPELKKRVMESLKDLVKKGLIRQFSHSGDQVFSMSPAKLDEIIARVRKMKSN